MINTHTNLFKDYSKINTAVPWNKDDLKDIETIANK